MLENIAKSGPTLKLVPRQKDKNVSNNIKPDYINIRTGGAICNNNISNNKNGENNAKTKQINK